jgi:hypothetical protein
MSESEHNFLEVYLSHTCMKVFCWPIQHTLKLDAVTDIKSRVYGKYLEQFLLGRFTKLQEVTTY